VANLQPTFPSQNYNYNYYYYYYYYYFQISHFSALAGKYLPINRIGLGGLICSLKIIIISKFLTSQLWLGNIHLSCDVVNNRIRLGGLICSLKSIIIIIIVINI